MLDDEEERDDLIDEDEDYDEEDEDEEDEEYENEVNFEDYEGLPFAVETIEGTFLSLSEKM